MKLRFFFLLLLLAVTSRGAVPVYKNDTLTLLPTNLLRSNILDSATVLWTLGTNGTMTANATGGSATNAQPPSPNLTNWSTITTQALRVAKTVFVSTNGTNATGAREWIHLPFASPRWAKTNAQAGDTIVVAPGVYDEDDLSKNGVNWTWMPGASVERSTGTTHIWHDQGIGAVTSVISGGRFKHSGTIEVVRMTNGASVMSFVDQEDMWQANAGNHSVIKQFSGSLSVRGLKRGRSEGYDFWWCDNATTRSYLQADLIQFDDTALEWAANWVRWGDAVANVGTFERIGSGSSVAMVLGDKTYVKGGVVKLAGDSQIYGSVGSTEGGILDVGVIESAPSATVSPVTGGDDLLTGPLWIRNARIVGPTSGNVSPLHLQTIFGGGRVTLENCELVAGAGATYSISSDGVAAGPVKIIGSLKANKDISPNAIIDNQGQFELPNLLSFHTNASARGSMTIGRKLATSPATVNLTADDTALDALYSYYRLSSDNATAANRTFTFDDFTVTPAAGTFFTLEWTDTDKGELIDNSANVIGANRLQGNWTPLQYDTLFLIFDGTDFVEVGRGNAGTGSFILSSNGSGTNTDFYGITESAGTNRMGNLAVTNRITQKIVTLAYTGTTNVTIDLSQGNIFALTATANTKFWPTNGPGAGWSQQAIVYVDMDGTGGYSFYKDDVTTETNYTSLAFTNTANAKNTMWITSDRTGTNFQFLVNPDFRK